MEIGSVIAAIVVLGVLQFVLAGFTDMSKYDDGYGKVELHHDA